ncbi:CBS and ACT domain-containing protein [Chloroflexota bacterium]
MRVRDIMTTKVLTVSSDTTINTAEEILSKHRIRRLPVVDKGKLVGVISMDAILKATAPSNAPIAIWKLPHFFLGMKVEEIMSKNLVTAAPDMTVASAAYLAQKKKVGCLPVIDNIRLVGIVTTNDFFYKVFNPLLGILQKGTQFTIRDPRNTSSIVEVFSCFNKHNARILAIRYIGTEPDNDRYLSIRVETTEESQLESDLKNLGYDVEILRFSDDV